VTDRFEWFAIDYNGSFWIDVPGNYRFRLASDDGSKLFINNTLLINNDGLHPTVTKEAALYLEQGVHHIQVQYYQGPRTEVALVLEVAREGESYQPFNSQKMAPKTEREAHAIPIETLWLDTYSPQNVGYSGPVASQTILEQGVSYLITIEGTYSAWNAEATRKFCNGTPEKEPMFPSPNTQNGQVSGDAAYAFANPSAWQPGCKEKLPRPARSLHFSLDGGDNWVQAEPLNPKLTREHRYHYTVMGQGHSLQIAFADKPTSDNFGQFKIQLQRASSQETTAPQQQPTFENFKRQSPMIQSIVKQGELRVGFEAGYLPFEMANTRGEFIGFDIDLARELAQEMGVKFTPVNTAWDGIIPALLANKFDIIISGMTITEDRSAHVNFSDPYVIIGQSIVLNKKHAKAVRSYQDLNNRRYTVTSQRGSTGEWVVKKVFPNCAYKSFDTPAEAAAEVLNGNADAFVYDLLFCLIFMGLEGKGQLIMLYEQFTKEPLGFAIRKGDPAFLEWLNYFLQTIRNDGRYERIYYKWLRETDWLQEVE
jgi:polar amino acid transport system substrate-binding protein